MNLIAKGAGALVATAGGIAIGRFVMARRQGSTNGGTPDGGSPDGGAGKAMTKATGKGNGKEARWHSVTVNRPLDEVAPEGRLPGPLADLAESVEVRVRPAPGDRGTELHARLRAGEPSGLGSVAARLSGNDPRFDVRRALREAKQLLETGEILSPSRPGTTQRTITNRPLEYATSHGREEGLL